MYILGQQSRGPQISPFELDQSLLNNAIRQGLDSPHEEVRDHFDWMQQNVALGEVRVNRGQDRADITQPGRGQEPLNTTLVFVDDDNPLVRVSARYRQVPKYTPEIRLITIPREVTASGVVLGGIVLHEGIHARDHQNPERLEDAPRFLPNISRPDAEHLLSEVNAFEAEGIHMRHLLGEEFSAYLQTEIDRGEQALEDLHANYQGGMGNVQVGVDTDKIYDAHARHASILDEDTRDYCDAIIRMVMPMHVLFQNVDSEAARYDQASQDLYTVSEKAAALGQGYLY